MTERVERDPAATDGDSGPDDVAGDDAVAETTEAVSSGGARGRAALIMSLVVGILLAGFIVVLATRKPVGDTVDSPLIGKAAPALEGTTLSGEKFELSRLRGSWVLVNFFATWCPPCIAEHPELVKFSEAHADGSASVVSVAYQNSADDIAKFFNERGGTWPVLASGTDEAVLGYGVVKLPESYLVAPNGMIYAKLAGGVTANGIDALIKKYEGSGG